ncbi:hypothetical protein PCASD_10557 [Puccinia coronata f. sp. avenae]|uniref:Uncharacterized protein n=1 Tax=Puccinia coronata f. sp. avenae TaxID=200324 RepID=A0A2N5UKU4_9BASI|nr:hypothetical protein PCASD_10557 [Puccinia coronata f. sp. avenae]
MAPFFFFESQLNFAVADSKDKLSVYNNVHNCRQPQCLGKTFGLFKLGREVVTAGFFSGYDFKSFVIEFTAVLVLVSSGSEYIKHSAPAPNSSISQPGTGNKEINFDSDNDTCSSPPSTNVVEPQYNRCISTNLFLQPPKKRGQSRAKKVVTDNNPVSSVIDL